MGRVVVVCCGCADDNVVVVASPASSSSPPQAPSTSAASTPRLTTSCGSTTERLNRPMYRPMRAWLTFCETIANGRLTIAAQPMPATAMNA